MKRRNLLLTQIALVVLLMQIASASWVNFPVRNGSYEEGILGSAPDNWVVKTMDTTSSPPPVGTYTHEAYGDDTHYFLGERSCYLHSRVVDTDGTVADRYSYTWIESENWIDAPSSAVYVRFYIRDIQPTHSLSWGWNDGICLGFIDGVVDDFDKYYIYNNGQTLNFNLYNDTKLGADGETWYEYAYPIPAEIDKSHFKVQINCIAGDWTFYDTSYFADMKFYVDNFELLSAVQPPIYIRPDGFVDGTDKIQRNGDNYTFADDINASIIVQRSNIVIDGNGHTLQNGSSVSPYARLAGFNLTNVNNVTIMNINIMNFSYGILLQSSYFSTVLRNNFTNPPISTGMVPVELDSAINCTITENNIDSTGDGIVLGDASANNTISNNTIRGVYNGIWFTSGIISVRFDNTNNTVVANVIEDCSTGIYLEESPWNSIVENVLSANDRGILLDSANNTIIVGNDVVDNNNYGISAGYSNDTYISGNNVSGNGMMGIGTVFASVNITNNYISNNTNGVLLLRSNGTEISGNNISDNHQNGVILYQTFENALYENVVSQNGNGTHLISSSNNKFYHNSFISNVCQANISSDSINQWDDGYPSGGNYWSPSAVVDELRGPNQDQPGSDGINDTKCSLDSNNVDNYPLIKPYGGPHDIGIVNVTASLSYVAIGDTVYINVKIINYGIATETFQLTMKINNYPLDWQTITIDARDSKSIQSPWDTFVFPKGIYTISASAGPVPNEWATSDNSYTDGQVQLHVSVIGGCGASPVTRTR